MGALQRDRGDFRQAHRAGLALGDDAGQALGQFLDRPAGLAPVDVEQVDRLDLQPLQAAVEFRLEIGRANC